MTYWAALREETRARWERRAKAYERSLVDLAEMHIRVWEQMVEKGKTEDLASEKSHSSDDGSAG